MKSELNKLFSSKTASPTRLDCNAAKESFSANLLDWFSFKITLNTCTTYKNLIKSAIANDLVVIQKKQINRKSNYRVDLLFQLFSEKLKVYIIFDLSQQYDVLMVYNAKSLMHKCLISANDCK